jgi:hypothetical protein
LGGRSPPSAAIRLSAARMAIAMRVAADDDPMCGDKATLSS